MFHCEITSVYSAPLQDEIQSRKGSPIRTKTARLVRPPGTSWGSVWSWEAVSNEGWKHVP